MHSSSMGKVKPVGLVSENGEEKGFDSLCNVLFLSYMTDKVVKLIKKQVNRRKIKPVQLFLVAQKNLI